LLKKIKELLGQRHGSVIGHFSIMQEALGLNPSTTKRRKKKEELVIPC
jgi:hypothetical protein